MIFIEGFDIRRNWVAGEQIGEEESDCPRYNESKDDLSQDLEPLGRKNIHVEKQGGLCEPKPTVERILTANFDCAVSQQGL